MFLNMQNIPKTEIEDEQEEKDNILKSTFSFNPKNNEPINALVLGKPGDGYPGQNLTDTIIFSPFKSCRRKSNFNLSSTRLFS